MVGGGACSPMDSSSSGTVAPVSDVTSLILPSINSLHESTGQVVGTTLYSTTQADTLQYDAIRCDTVV